MDARAPQGGGGGGYSNFFRIRRLGPSIYRSPKKISGISSTPKFFEILAPPKNIPILYLDLKKTIDCIEMTLKLAQFCDDPKKYPPISIPPKNIHFSENPQKY